MDVVLSKRPRQLVYGGGGAVTRLVCGYLACDARLARMLLAGLPPVVTVNVRASNAGAWLEASLRYALSEARSPRPGGMGVLAKLSEVLFIEFLRIYMDQQTPGRTGWLAGVGAAVSAAGRQVFASDGWVAAKVPASASAIWSLAILGLVLVTARVPVLPRSRRRCRWRPASSSCSCRSPASVRGPAKCASPSMGRVPTVP